MRILRMFCILFLVNIFSDTSSILLFVYLENKSFYSSINQFELSMMTNIGFYNLLLR